MQIFYTTFFAPKQLDYYFQEMPKDIQERIRRYRKVENKYQLLLGRLLLKEGMQELGYKDFKLEDIYYNDNNCPLWREDVFFNIAHSGNVVACVFSNEEPAGIDVEKIRPVNLKDFDYILNKEDHKNIQKATNPYQAFFKIWTIKEALTKALGKGLAIDVQQIYVYDDYAVFERGIWYYHSLDLEIGFAAHLVSKNKHNIAVELKSYDL